MEQCILCNTTLEFSNTPLWGKGILKDGQKICTKCYKKINKINPSIASNLKKYSLEEINELLSAQKKIDLLKNKNSRTDYVIKAKIIVASVLGILIFIGLLFSENSQKNDIPTKKEQHIVPVENYTFFSNKITTLHYFNIAKFDSFSNDWDLRNGIKSNVDVTFRDDLVRIKMDGVTIYTFKQVKDSLKKGEHTSMRYKDESGLEFELTFLNNSTQTMMFHILEGDNLLLFL